MKRKPTALLQIGFTLALALFIGVAWVERRYTKLMAQAAASVAHSHEVQSSVYRLLALIEDIETATNGTEALKVFAARAAEVRLVLTDLKMPMLDGTALIAALRQLHPNLPVVAMSGAESLEAAPPNAPATAFLAKPFQVETLLAIVRHTLDAASPPVPPPT